MYSNIRTGVLVNRYSSQELLVLDIVCDYKSLGALQQSIFVIVLIERSLLHIQHCVIYL